MKKKTEKAELCKLKLKAEQTMLEKFKSSAYDLHIPHKKADGSKKRSEDVGIPKKPYDTSTGTVDDRRSSTKKSNTLSRTWEEEYEEEYKEFSTKKRHVSKRTPSRASAETPERWDFSKRKKQDDGSGKAAGASRTGEGDFEATALHFKQVMRT